ncbi:iron ABC transporter permease [Halapricum salinum]|uniref:Iron ABC transporter permease n=1 Tax=Halapricum salinum TaxID=1457250 RepID=A0A4D6HD73_9EURY|nr:iron ABC transporter permease [Halapricum salinum]
MDNDTLKRFARAFDSLQTYLRSALTSRVGLFLVPFVFLLTLIGIPLAFFFWSSLWTTTPGFGGEVTLSGYETLLTHPDVHQTLWNTAILTIFGTLVALVIGISAVIFTLKMDLPRWVQSTVSALMIVQFLIPDFIQGLAWDFYLDPYGPINRILVLFPMINEPVVSANNIWTIAFIFGTHYAGLVYLLTSGAARSIPPQLEEMSLISGAGRRTIFARIDLPLIVPSLLVATVIVFVRGVQSFSLPLVLGLQNQVYTVASLMYLELSEFPVNFTFVGSLGVTILFVSLWLLAIQRRLVGSDARYETITGHGEHTDSFRYYHNNYFTVSFVLLLVIVYILPITMIFIGSLQRAWVGFRFEFVQWSLEGYRGLLFGTWTDVFQESLLNSAIVGVATGTLAIILGLIISYLSVKTDWGGGTVLGYLSYAPIAIPGIVLASALQWLILEYNDLLGFLYGSLIIIAIAFAAKFLVYGVRAANSSLRSIGSNLDEIARVSGANRSVLLREIYAPLIAPGLLAGFIIIVVDTTKSLSIPIILGGNQDMIVQSAIWYFISQGELNVAAAYSVLLISGVTLLYMLAYRLGFDLTSI